MNMIVSFLVVTSLLFGGGATVNAAQNDLPGEPLYTLKVWSEDVGLQFQNNQETKVDRLMEMAETRVQEMTELAAEGKPIPDSVRQRLEQHLHQALQLCTSMDDATLDRTLLQVRDRLQKQDQEMDRLQLHTQSQDTLQLLTQTRTMLQERLHLVEGGLLDHEMFRNTVRNGFQHGQEDPATPPAPAQNQNMQQNGQPTTVPGGSDVNPGGPNENSGNDTVSPGGPNTDPGGPNVDPGGPNTDSGGSNTDSGQNNPDTDNGTSSGSGTGGNGSGSSSSGNGTGGNGNRP